MIAKRLFDLLFAMAGLLLLAPLFVVIAVWIRFDSQGPVFFRQERIGRFGIPFRIFKFRTMESDAETKGKQITAGRDPRITRSGQFLRHYKLDELPQLLNVIKGEMSLVGPRPEVPRYVRYYPDELKEIVLSVPPGITDYASIEYRDENALLGQAEDPESVYIHEILPCKLKHCVCYVRERSLWVDLKIILRTLGAIGR